MNSISRHAMAVAALLTATALLVARTSATAAPAPTVARFHLALSKTEPAVNDTVASSPKVIKLWFTQEVKASVTSLRVVGPAKQVVPTGAITIDTAPKSPAIAEIQEPLKPGKYSVEWKTLAADGHPNKGSFAFTIGKKAAR